MPGIRVHEIAREIGKTNKEVITFLKDHGIEVRSHMSSLKEAEEKLLRETFDKDKNMKNEKKEEGRTEAKPKKKSNIIQVFRPQNAKTPEGKNLGRGKRSDSRKGKPAADGKPSQRPARPAAENAAAKAAQNKETSRPAAGNAGGRTGSSPAHGKPAQTQETENKGRQRNSQGTNQRPPRSDSPRRFQADRERDKDRDTKEGRDSRRNGSEGRKSGGRKQQTDAVDTSMMQKPSRDLRKDKEKEKEKEKAKDKFGGDRQKGGRRPNQGFRQQARLPKALQKPVHQHKEEKKAEVKEIVLPEKLTIRELADKMKMQPSVIVKKLFMEGVMVTVNHEIDFEKAQEIALDYDIIAEPEEKVDVIEELLKEEEDDASTLVPRPPVVCVMGHVDHGKTSLLDAIRNTHVTDREAGGITQHIGAYMVKVNGQKITFLDTPGHEAFTAMRMRGANATDIAILVVAADDGVMPQTIEAINHAKAAGVEIIVAINKIDKPNANVERVKQELSEYELIPEDWGGSTIFVPVSAHTHEGIEELLEMILLTAEVCELKANPKRKARGLVIEAKLDKGKGPVATILVQKGTLHVGDFIAAGACSGKVRAMMDDKGRRVKEAGPSTPVEILGLGDVPNAGEVLVATENDKEAKNFAATFVSENRNRLLEETKSKMSLDDLFNQIQEGNLKELGIVVKADVQGSVEAVKQSLLKLSNDEVVVKIVHGGVGAINESDVTLASASNAIIIGFNVRPDATAKAIAE